MLFFILSLLVELIPPSHPVLVYIQVQALVGFEKTIKHLDDHLVDIGSKVDLLLNKVFSLKNSVPGYFFLQ